MFSARTSYTWLAVVKTPYGRLWIVKSHPSGTGTKLSSTILAERHGWSTTSGTRHFTSVCQLAKRGTNRWTERGFTHNNAREMSTQPGGTQNDYSVYGYVERAGGITDRWTHPLRIINEKCSFRTASSGHCTTDNERRETGKICEYRYASSTVESEYEQYNELKGKRTTTWNDNEPWSLP